MTGVAYNLRFTITRQSNHFYAHPVSISYNKVSKIKYEKCTHGQKAYERYDSTKDYYFFKKLQKE